MIYITLDSFRCHEETNEVGDDEPYVLVAAIDLTATVNVGGFPIPIAASRVFRYGPFGGVSAAKTYQSPFISFWGLNGEERGLANPNDAVFLVGLKEHDDGHTERTRAAVAGLVQSALFSTASITDRAVRVERVRQEFDSALLIPGGGPSTDERIGNAQVLQFSPAEIAIAETGQKATRSLQFRGDGGNYTLIFAACNRGQNAWRFCHKCRSLFFDGFENKGACPGGGGHAAAGWTFYLPHDRPGPVGGQPGWRFCDRCCAMFWSGDPRNQGRCHAGGAHRAQGYNFFLPHDHGGFGQDQWRFCDRCRVMFWNGEANKGVCAAGGVHNAQGFNFRLDYTP